MKLKKIPRRKKIKFIFIIILIYVVFAYTFYYSFKNNQSITNKAFVNYLLNNGNAFIYEEYKIPKVINSTLGYILKIDITKPDSLFNENIIGYHENEEDNNEDIEQLKRISSYISDPNKVDIKNPVIYIYNSHQF